MERVQLKQERERSAPNRMLFTDLAIERLRPPKAGQELYWDTAQKGLSLLVSGKGAKTFRSQFKLNGKWLTRTIGRFGEAPIKEEEKAKEDSQIVWAREQVRNDRALAKQGIDPRETEQASERATRKLTFEDAVDDFIEKYAKPRQRTWKQTQDVLKRNCKPWLNRPIASITKTDAYSLLDGFVAEGHGPKAKLTLAWIKTLWRWAWKRDVVPTPLMDAVDIHVEKRERRHFTDDEVKAIWQAADKLTPTEAAYVKALILLAPRKTALAQMRRSQWDHPEDPTVWTVPYELTKTKKMAQRKRVYLVPLPPLAQRILKSVPRREGDPDLVFPGRHKGKPLSPSSPLTRKLVKAGAPADFYCHGVRHSLATWLENEGHSEFERGVVLDHAGGGTVTAGYSHGYPLELKRQLLEKWCQHVEGLVTAKGVALLR